MELNSEQKAIQLLSALVYAMEEELVMTGLAGNISTTARALAHKIKVEYMEDNNIKAFEDIEELFHPIELTKTFRKSMVLLKQQWDSMGKE
jgi:hypothetical protein